MDTVDRTEESGTWEQETDKQPAVALAIPTPSFSNSRTPIKHASNSSSFGPSMSGSFGAIDILSTSVNRMQGVGIARTLSPVKLRVKWVA